jgi:hypothetical protein
LANIHFNKFRDNENLLDLDIDDEDPFLKKVFIYGQRYKDTVGLFVMSSETLDNQIAQKYKLLFKRIHLQMIEHNRTVINKIKIRFPPLRENNGVYYFFYNRLNSFVSFKENLIRANFLSNKMKVNSYLILTNRNKSST